MADLYLLRHGIAEERRAGRADESRRLTPEGRKKLHWVLQVAQVAGVRVGVIVSSPLVRAVETAEMAAEVLGGTLERDPALSPGSTPDAVIGAARSRQAHGPIMLVGHEPLLGETSTFLFQAAGPVIVFKKGALACFETELKDKEITGVLKWYLTPRVCHGI